MFYKQNSIEPMNVTMIDWGLLDSSIRADAIFGKWHRREERSSLFTNYLHFVEDVKVEEKGELPQFDSGKLVAVVHVLETKVSAYKTSKWWVDYESKRCGVNVTEYFFHSFNLFLFVFSTLSESYLSVI